MNVHTHYVCTVVHILSIQHTQCMYVSTYVRTYGTSHKKLDDERRSNCVRTVTDRALTAVRTAYVRVLFVPTRFFLYAYVRVLFVPTRFFLYLTLSQLACGFCLCTLKRNSLLFVPKISHSCSENRFQRTAINSQ